MIQKSHFPFLLLLLMLLVFGGIASKDFGISWDEPLYYAYGEAAPYAYSLSARLEGTFDIERAYGPSAEDHKMYGPAYLLVAQPVVIAINQILGTDTFDGWHLVNFLFFLVGVVFLYKLSLRWMSHGPACLTALVYATQPVLWGHAFINPKDSPFMTIFILTIYTGYRLTDVLSAPGEADLSPNPDGVQSDWSKMRRVMMMLGGAGLVSLLIFLGMATWRREFVDQMVMAFYTATPESLMGRGFAWIAPNASNIPIEAYLNKAAILFVLVQRVLMVVGLLLALGGALAAFFSKPLVRLFTKWETSPYGPLPRMPFWGGTEALRNPGKWLLLSLVGGLLLGVSTTLRVLAPLAGVLILTHFMLRSERRPFFPWLVYGFSAVIGMYATWPFLWDAPLKRFGEVLTYMSYKPKSTPVLFDGIIYPSLNLPGTYFPKMLMLTLTEPVILLSFLGAGWVIIAWMRRFSEEHFKKPVELHIPEARSLIPIFAWFAVPFGYVILLRPPMYDGYRHFLFTLPPLFILAGIGFQILSQRIRIPKVRFLLAAFVLLPGIIGIVRMHPYPYAYYNSLAGGVGGAFRAYETDYWLTCYQELVLRLNEEVPSATTLFVFRQPELAAIYADDRLTIQPYEPEQDQTFPGSLILLSTRANRDLEIHPDDPVRDEVGRDGATFCLLREVK